MLHGREAKGKDLVLRINDEEIADPNLAGKEFNNYFSSVASSLASTIPPVDPLTHVQRLEKTFVWCDVTAEESHKIILYFKSKMSSINDIPNFIYKHISPIFIRSSAILLLVCQAGCLSP